MSVSITELEEILFEGLFPNMPSEPNIVFALEWSKRPRYDFFCVSALRYDSTIQKI